MALQEDLKSRLIRLTRMIHQSKNVKNQIKNVFKDATIDNFESKGIEKNKAEIYSLYQGRNNLLMKKCIYSEAYGVVLNNLSNVDDYCQICLTPLTIDNKLYLIFSDNDYKECFGIIFKDW